MLIPVKSINKPGLIHWLLSIYSLRFHSTGSFLSGLSANDGSQSIIKTQRTGSELLELERSLLCLKRSTWVLSIKPPSMMNSFSARVSKMFLHKVTPLSFSYKDWYALLFHWTPWIVRIIPEILLRVHALYRCY